MSRADRFDRADFDSRYIEPSAAPAASAARPGSPVGPRSLDTSAPAKAGPGPLHELSVHWPLVPGQLKRVGQSVLADRNGQGRPHKGIDLFADAGTRVLAASAGTVLRVVDGRTSPHAALRRAGLFVDVLARDALVYRYLHLGESRVRPGGVVVPGTVLGTVASANTSGLSQAPHVHFEVRQGDFDSHRKDYGTPLDPLRLLPPLRA